MKAALKNVIFKKKLTNELTNFGDFDKIQRLEDDGLTPGLVEGALWNALFNVRFLPFFYWTCT